MEASQPDSLARQARKLGKSWNSFPMLLQLQQLSPLGPAPAPFAILLSPLASPFPQRAGRTTLLPYNFSFFFTFLVRTIIHLWFSPFLRWPRPRARLGCIFIANFVLLQSQHLHTAPHSAYMYVCMCKCLFLRHPTWGYCHYVFWFAVC